MNITTSLVFADAQTGKVLDENGNWALHGQGFTPVFETKEQAVACMTDYLEKHAHAECWLRSPDPSIDPVRVLNPKAADYFREKAEWTRWRMSWFRWFRTEPVGEYFRPPHQ